MRKFLAGAIASLLLITFSPPVFALGGTGTDYSPCAGNNGKIVGNIICKIDAENPGGVIGAIISFVLFLAVFIAFVFLVIGGLRWITSGGDKSAVESARNTIIAAIIGLVVAFLAYLIITLILGFLGLTFDTLTLPRLPGADSSSTNTNNTGGPSSATCRGFVNRDQCRSGGCQWAQTPDTSGVLQGSCYTIPFTR